jgi:hypothetical protein
VINQFSRRYRLDWIRFKQMFYTAGALLAELLWGFCYARL